MAVTMSAQLEYQARLLPIGRISEVLHSRSGSSTRLFLKPRHGRRTDSPNGRTARSQVACCVRP